MIDRIQKDLQTALEELYAVSKVDENGMIVAGCSTSEVVGKKIGTSGSGEAALAIFETLAAFCLKYKLFLAAQCCEHLNRALVVEKRAQKIFNLTRVNAIPYPDAGGAFATAVYAGMDEPVLVENVQADFGIDIGNTLIGMHIRPVVVPVRVSIGEIGEAHLVLARSRCKFTGGERARYNPLLG